MAPADGVPRDPADEAMVARAHERFASERRRARHGFGQGSGALPNLLVIGGLKCGTTSLHHYLNLHPEIAMSRPKELNFFVEQLNWSLGRDWYEAHFDADAPVRGETSPHYTNRPRFAGVAQRIGAMVGTARLIYMVRDPIDRMLSHYLHNLGGGYETRGLTEALSDADSAYVARSRYAFQLEPYLDTFPPESIEIVTREELKEDRPATMRRVYAFLGVEDAFTSEQFAREWETGTSKGGDRFRLMDRAVRMPGLRALDRNFDRLPERLRWLVERMVHDPGAGEVPKPDVPPGLREWLTKLFRDDVSRVQELAGRRFGWLDQRAPGESSPDA